MDDLQPDTQRPRPRAQPQGSFGSLGSLSSGGFRLFQAFGITVFLHWSWIFVAIYEIQARKGEYSKIGWNIAEYVSLFLIVLLHEFGHALACKSVGGRADRIILWPLGGVAFVNPPQRAGAMLWSIAAGPLVNVALLPVLWVASRATLGMGTDLHRYFHNVAFINLLLLVFNLLPIYPLDGGQILRSVLWFVIGRAWSLIVASVIGLIGAAGVALYFLGTAFLAQDFSDLLWPLILAGFGGMQSFRGLQVGLAMRRMEQLPRYSGPRCPSCGAAPPAAPVWQCSCGQRFDTFATFGTCPGCGRRANYTTCFDCGKAAPMQAWFPELQGALPPTPQPVAPDHQPMPAAPAGLSPVTGMAVLSPPSPPPASLGTTPVPQWDAGLD